MPFLSCNENRQTYFYAEGWHYELENENDELNIKGVVYNEMKGAYSNPETFLYYRNNQVLCPDTVYAVESVRSTL